MPIRYTQDLPYYLLCFKIITTVALLQMEGYLHYKKPPN